MPDNALRRGAAFWAGWVLSILPAGVMLLSGTMKVTHAGPVIENWARFGYPLGTLTLVGALEIVCAVLFLIPRTAFFGAVLVAAYLGGAVATHVRISDPSAIAPAVLGTLAWVGLWLRDTRLRALAPLRS
jgi:uncharacterized membrane protein YphA (DoxX/SURF4 family)